MTDEHWRHLTSVARKRDCYRRDPHFREAMYDGVRILGDELFAALHSVALLAFKPEALAGRRVDAVLRFVTKHRFTPMCIVPLVFTRHIVRELWRYQWNAATIEKMELADRLNCALPTVMLLLRDDRLPRELPASVRLKTLKGSAVTAGRDVGSLRAAIAAPNRMITFVHAPDEPADVIRELGVFFDRPTRLAILSNLRCGLSSDATRRCERQLRELEQRAPHADLDHRAAWQRVLAGAEDHADELLARQHRCFCDYGEIEWWHFLSLCANVGADEWDVITICAEVVEHEDPGQVPVLTFDGAAVAGWLNGGAELCRTRV